MKSVLDYLSSLFPVKLTIGREKDSLAASVASSSSVVYGNNDVAILLAFALMLTTIALIIALSRS
jgi:hypothetical protein